MGNNGLWSPGTGNWWYSQGKEVFRFFFDYEFVRGRAKMKSLHDLPPPRVYVMDKGCIYPLHIIIPQPDSPDAPIETNNVTNVSKMLDVHISLARNLSMHVERMVQKGIDWVDCLHTKPVSRGDAWLSFYLHFFPESCGV